MDFNYRPNMPQPNVAGFVAQVQANGGTTAGGVYTRGSYLGSPVYDIRAIFAALGKEPSDGALRAPDGCDTSSRPANASGNCALYWDMKPFGLKQNPPGRGQSNDYYIDGVHNGGEIFGPGRTGEQGAQRLIDFSRLGADPPIFIGANLHVDWDISNEEMPGQRTFGFAIRGRATIVATNDITLSDNILYRNGLNTTNLADADFLGVIAQRDIWYGYPTGDPR